MVKRSFKKYKIGIIGIGFVGGAVKRYFESIGLKPFFYDKYKKIGSLKKVNLADVIFVCVSTPYNKKKGCDLSFVKDVCKNISGSKIIVIKSTVVPGTTQKLQGEYSQHKFLFNPEFLREASAYKDFINPDRQIVGFTKKSKKVAYSIMKILPKAPYQKIMLAEEAEMIKYMNNTFLATKVLLANEFYDLCTALKINYDVVKDAVSQDPRIGKSHLDIFRNGYRGYGGSCFPKDINTIIKFASDKKVDMLFLKKAREINRLLLKQSGFKEDYFLNFLHRKKNDKKT